MDIMDIGHFGHFRGNSLHPLQRRSHLSGRLSHPLRRLSPPSGAINPPAADKLPTGRDYKEISRCCKEIFICCKEKIFRLTHAENTYKKKMQQKPKKIRKKLAVFRKTSYLCSVKKYLNKYNH